MRRILCILLLLLCGLTPAQKKVLLQGSQDYEQLIRQHQPTLWLDASDPTTITASAGAISAWASKVGAISFTQATGANQPSLTRYDNLENQLTNNNDFSNATGGYTEDNITPTANATTNPLDGATTAYKLAENGATSTHRIYKVLSAITAGQYTESVYVKRFGTSDGSKQFQLVLDANRGVFARFDLALGTKVSDSLTTSTIESLGDGWYRCSATGTVLAGSIIRFSMGYNATYDGDGGTSGIYLYGAQFRSSLADPSYLATTTYPQYRGINGRSAVRFDGSDDTMTATATLGDIFAAGAKTAIGVVQLRSVSTGTPQAILRTSDLYWYFIENGAGLLGVYNYDGSIDYVYSAAVAVNKTYVLISTQEGGYLTLLTNGVASTPVASGNTGDVSGILALGNCSDSSCPWVGSIAELITFNKVLPSDVRIKIQKGLCKKWGASC